MNPLYGTFTAHHPCTTNKENASARFYYLATPPICLGLFIFSAYSRIFHGDAFYLRRIKGRNDFSALRRRNAKKYLAILAWRARDKGAKGPSFVDGWARALSSLVFYFSTDRTTVNILFIMLHLRSIPLCTYVYVFLRPRDRECVMWCTFLGPQTPLLYRARKNVRAWMHH